jgi:hypothetical protein
MHASINMFKVFKVQGSDRRRHTSINMFKV